jgi:hypothetical protein
MLRQWELKEKYILNIPMNGAQKFNYTTDEG